LVILSGLRKDKDEYMDGQILGPDNGATYRSKAKLLESGAKLSVAMATSAFLHLDKRRSGSAKSDAPVDANIKVT